MRKPRRARPWALYAFWGFFILVVIGWTSWWFILRATMEARVEKWAAAQKGQGAQASYSKISASGYPLRLTLTFDNFAYVAPGGGWSLASPQVALHVNPSDLGLYILEPRATVTWTTRAATHTFTPRENAISVRTDGEHAERVTLEGEGVVVTRNGAPEATIGKIVLSVRPDPRSAEDGQLAVDVDALDLAAPPKGFEAFGARIQSLNARIVFENGAALMAPGVDRIGAWRAANGAARVEGLGLAWGPATVTSKGRFVIDDGRRLAGRLDLDLAKPADVFGAIARSPTMSPDISRMMQMLALANAVQGSSLTAPLVIQNGVLLVKGVPIRTIEPIR